MNTPTERSSTNVIQEYIQNKCLQCSTKNFMYYVSDSGSIIHLQNQKYIHGVQSLIDRCQLIKFYAYTFVMQKTDRNASSKARQDLTRISMLLSSPKLQFFPNTLQTINYSKCPVR